MARAFQAEQQAVLREEGDGQVSHPGGTFAVHPRSGSRLLPPSARERGQVLPSLAGTPALLRADGALRVRQLRRVSVTAGQGERGAGGRG